MKKFLLPLVAMLFCVTACNKDNEGTLKLEVEQYTSNTKLHLDNNYAVWDNNDAVWVNGTSYAVSVNGTSAALTGVTENNGYKAVYPASWVSTSATASSEIIGIVYPAEQTYRKNTAGQQVIDAPMAAYSDGNGTLKFYNLGSILAVNVTNSNSETMSVQKIEVSSASLINGTYNVWDITTAPRLQITMGGGGRTTTLLCNGESIAAGATKTFYIAMPTHYASATADCGFSPQLTIKVYDQYYTYTKAQGSAHTMESNHGYNAPIATTDNPVQYAPFSNQIWYKTTDDQPVDFLGSHTTTTNSLGYFVATYSSNITSIPITGLYGKSTLTDIILPEGLTSIGEQAFIWCGSLENIVLPYSLTYIGPSAFWGCGIETIEIPNPNVKLGNNIFYQSSIQTVILHSNNVFTADDISLWSRLYGFLQDMYEMYGNMEEPLADANDNFFWFLNSDAGTRVAVYVPDVDACTSISYSMGIVEQTEYFYYPWQNQLDREKINLYPLSSL